MPRAFFSSQTREMEPFQLKCPFNPSGDQPQAIEALTREFKAGKKQQCLLGVTGSGKTFTMAHVIEALGAPTLIISHNKTLAAQLFEEMRELFPNNAVEYFVSYYDYYQPEAYIPQRDIYIEKDASRNEDIDLLRLRATSSLVSRRDTIIVASVSCIYGLGSPEDFKRSVIAIEVGQVMDRDALLKQLIELQYTRNAIDMDRKCFRVRGDVVEVFPAGEEFITRIEFFGDEIEKIELLHPVNGESLGMLGKTFIFPAVHYVMPVERIEGACQSIIEELDQRLLELRSQGKLLEAQRLAARTKYDVEMIREVGYCSGIENYTRHLHGSKAGDKPFTLVDYFPKDFLLIVDESHATLPQVGAMFNGDQARKKVLVEHGFRLPSCLDNRPMKFEEFEGMWNQTLYVSATPGPMELEKCRGEVVEQIIRPTGLVDPIVEVRPARGQVPDLLHQVHERVAAGERVLVTTLTKRLAEELTGYMADQGFKVEYLHSDIDTIERVAILKALREGTHDVVVGVNLLREGLDLPEVSLVAILDADKEGFLRSETSLVQMIGRAARNVNAKVVLYADRMTGSMTRAMDETNRRRAIQIAYNAKHGIKPETIKKAIRTSLMNEVNARRTAAEAIRATEDELDRAELISMLEAEMLAAAQDLEFEKAARIRDKLLEIRNAGKKGGQDGAEADGAADSGKGSYMSAADRIISGSKRSERGRHPKKSKSGRKQT